jgi:hypothetical protein
MGAHDVRPLEQVAEPGDQIVQRDLDLLQQEVDAIGDVAQAGGAVGLLVLSFQHQFGSDLSRPTKLAVALLITVGLATWWRLTRPSGTLV